MTPNTPLVSVVIRCRNEGHSLREVLTALSHQRCDFAWELVVVDNESSDDTLAIAAEFGARVVPITQREFTYGKALNWGIAAAKGELIFLLSAHALPLTAHFLASAVEPFADPQMAAVRCMMIGNDHQLRRWFAPADIQYASPEEQRVAEAGTHWLGQYPTAGCCLLRRNVWEQIPFDETLESNEDKHWVSLALARGLKIRCCADAVWIYLRKRTGAQARNRQFREELSLYRLNGHARLRWPGYVVAVCRSLVSFPLRAARQAFDQIARDTNSVLVPWYGRRASKLGSHPDFEPGQTGGPQAIAAASKPQPNVAASL